jgi:RNA polymerase sigma-70 factor (family 1)
MDSWNKDFKSFYLSYYTSLVRFLNTYWDKADEMEDIAQETFIRLYQNWKEIDSEDSARALMYTTAKNLCISRHRHLAVENQYIVSVLEKEKLAADDQSIDDESPFFSNVTYQETLRLLYDIIQQLPKQSRQVILLSLDGKGNTEIADEMNISINTVKTLKRRAYKLLRESFGNSPIGKELLTLIAIIVFQQ